MKAKKVGIGVGALKVANKLMLSKSESQHRHWGLKVGKQAYDSQCNLLYGAEVVELEAGALLGLHVVPFKDLDRYDKTCKYL